MSDAIERLIHTYGEACDAMGQAHANGTRADWLAAVDREEAARAALLSALRASTASESSLRGALEGIAGVPERGEGAIFYLRLMAKTAKAYAEHRCPADDLHRCIRDALKESDRIAAAARAVLLPEGTP